VNRYVQCVLLAFLAAAVLSAPLSVQAAPIIINHTRTNIHSIPESAIVDAKSKLHIAYAHTSHGSQVTTGMDGLVDFMNGLGYTHDLYDWNNGGTGGALDLHDGFAPNDLGDSAWPQNTRNYLNNAANKDVNVVMWSWCGQAGYADTDINAYLSSMTQLETEFPTVKFVYMTGHLVGEGATGTLYANNQKIRNYCLANDKILYDFADIESYDPDWQTNGKNYMLLKANDNCDYDSDANGSLDKNWALDWQAKHTENVDWYDCGAAHSQSLNGNLKAYAAWALWTDIAAVPEPGTLALLAVGLLGCAWIGRRCRAV
jgi:hypothetical protein